jgi:NAD(P)H-flavin reductase
MTISWENDPRPVQIVENRLLARATCWISLKILDDKPILYHPGHVLALFVDVDGERLRHPYTVNAVDTGSREIGLLVRVIKGGVFTTTLSYLGQGNKISILGRFGKSVREQVHPNATSFLGISTGSGIGPLAGFAREALMDPGWKLPITLLTGFREEVDVPLDDQLSMMEEPGRFTWQPSLTKGRPEYAGLRGRVTATLPDAISSLRDTHVHLVGNGAMVVDIKTAWKQAGLPAELLTSETYFNRIATPNAQVVAGLVPKLKTLASRLPES